MKQLARLALALACLLSSSLAACEDPAILATVAARNTVIAAEATTSPVVTVTASQGVTASVTPSVTPEPAVTPVVEPTCSICEVSPTPATPTGPIEVGTPISAIGTITQRNGWYAPDNDENLRTCPAKTCDLVPGGTLIGHHSYPTQGWINNVDGTTWMCEVIDVDKHGAQLCLYAALLWDNVKGYYGTYVPGVTK